MLGTVSNADTYLSENTAWQALSEAEKTSLLKQANVVLGLFNWKGARSASDQVDIWPRYGVVVDGYQVPSDTVPENITDALYELCGFGSASKTLFATAANLTPQKKTLKVGPITIATDSTEAKGQVITNNQHQSQFVNALLQPYVETSNKLHR